MNLYWLLFKAFRDVNALRQAALNRFSIPLLSSTKKSLWEQCSRNFSSLELPFTPRRSSEKRSQAAADLDNILLAFSKLDEVVKIPQICCEGSDLVELPPIAADSISELVFRNSICLKEIEGKISRLHDDLAWLRTLTAKVKTSISSTPCLPNSYASAVKAVASNVAGSPSHRVSRLDRADNLVIFGLPEAEFLPTFKGSVDELLNFRTGRPVPVKNLYRLGRHKNTSEQSTPSRPRTVMLKLMSSWDRWLVLSAVCDLKGFSVKGVRTFLRRNG